MPKIVAHRGGAGLRPENTLAACGHALEAGADGIEIDVRLSADGLVMVFHDSALDPRHVRTEGGARLDGEPPLVRDLTFDELRMFDVGYPRDGAAGGAFAPVPGERIPSLAELLDFVDGLSRKPLLLIELKTDFHTASSLDPTELTEAVLAVLEERDGEIPFRLMSFDWRCLAHAMKFASTEQCVFLSAPNAAEPATAPGGTPWFAGHPPSRHGSEVRAICALGGRHWGPHHSRLDAQTVSEAQEAGLGIATWTVNEPRHLMRMRALGVDALITDYPDLARIPHTGHGLRADPHADRAGEARSAMPGHRTSVSTPPVRTRGAPEGPGSDGRPRRRSPQP